MDYGPDPVRKRLFQNSALTILIRLRSAARYCHWRNRSISEMFEACAARYAERDAFIFEGVRWSFGRFNAYTNQVAYLFRTQVDLVHGDVVAVFMTSR